MHYTLFKSLDMTRIALRGELREAKTLREQKRIQASLTEIERRIRQIDPPRPAR